MQDELWPFFFEVNLIQRKAFRERTVFVTVEEDGNSSWMDHTGRFTRRGGFGGLSSDAHGNLVHTRGNRQLTEEEEEAERREFSINAAIPPEEFRPIREMIDRVGKPWTAGWDSEDSTEMHRLLEEVYWKHVNRFMHEPFDPADR